LRNRRKICLQYFKVYATTKAKKEAGTKNETKRKAQAVLLLHMLLGEPNDQFDQHHWH
jgi:hypothetical protein